MQYNSQKEILIISEYGRNVQNLINHAQNIEDTEERQRFVEALVDLMHQMNPVNKNNQDYKEKLWRHLFRIANYDIKVVPPSGVIPTPESSHLKPSTIKYPEIQKSHRHYGKYVKTLIEKAIKMEDEEKKAEFVMVIASYMKIAYRTWNREHYVSDEVIQADLKALSNGQLSLPENAVIDISSVPHRTKKSYYQSGKGGHRGKKGGRRRR